MPAQDITRNLLQPGKHYVGARMQQGRPILDSDWNEDAALEAEDLRTTLLDITGAYGSSNAGFHVSGVQPQWVLSAQGQSVGTYDFEVGAGSFFVGGIRVETESGESFLDQPDWLMLREAASNLPVKPMIDDLALSGGIRHDLVYLHVWEQPVSVVEDGELRERAQGGGDSSTRVRRMHRVEVACGVSSESPDLALAEALSALTNEAGVYEPSTGELRSQIRMGISPVTQGGDPCGSQQIGGYVGHENQAIRIELRGPRSFTWGFCNASPLYRVEALSSTRIRLVTQPRDELLRPRADQIVEILPASAMLSNGEHTAELHGQLARVVTGYNPKTGEIEIDTELPTTWTTSSTQTSATGTSTNLWTAPQLFMRVWDRGSDVTSPLEIPFVSHQPVPLGHTGLQATFLGVGRTGDFWVVAARKTTPKQVWPWELLQGVAPQGTRHYYAPLAVLTWKSRLRIIGLTQVAGADPVLGIEAGIGAPLEPPPIDAPFAYQLFETVKINPGELALQIIENKTVIAHPPKSNLPNLVPLMSGQHAELDLLLAVRDVRRRLEPLCQRGCCTVVVGDGVTSFGQVNSLQEALTLLPAGGGRICLLPGRHVGGAGMLGRSNVTISGCGAESVLVNAADVPLGAPLTTQGTALLTLTDCTDIVIKNLTVEADASVGIKLKNDDARCKRIRIEQVHFDLRGEYVSPNGALPQAAVLAIDVDTLDIVNCRVDVQDVLNYVPALVVGGEHLRLRGNWIQVGELESPTIAAAMGGIQVLSQSIDVELRGNTIYGGWGHGIALGHVLVIDPPEASPDLDILQDEVWTQAERRLGEALSGALGWVPVTGAPAGTLLVSEFRTPAGPVIDVRVVGNRICRMGLSGVSTAFFFDVNQNAPRFIVAVDTEIRDNVITENARAAIPKVNFADFDLALGGICIAGAINLNIRENVIRDQGLGLSDLTPICGIGVVVAQNVIIDDNAILDNGVATAAPDTLIPAPGLRGGICLHEVGPVLGYTINDRLTNTNLSLPDMTFGESEQALVVHQNEVRQRTGKALWVRRGFGPMSITENSLHSFGDPVDGCAMPNSYLYFADISAGGGGYKRFPAQGACVEIINFGTSAEASETGTVNPSWLDTEAHAIADGRVLFSSNDVRLDWHWNDGYATSVLVSSLDSIVGNHNVMVAKMNNSTYVPGSGSADYVNKKFITDVLNDRPGATPPVYSYLLVNCWFGGTSTVQAVGNRFEEPRWDVLVSYLGADPAGHPAGESADVINATLAAMNVGSHCIVGRGITNKKFSSNVTVFPVLGYPECTYTVYTMFVGSDQEEHIEIA